jgi:hypothetical protein
LDDLRAFAHDDPNPPSPELAQRQTLDSSKTFINVTPGIKASTAIPASENSKSKGASLRLAHSLQPTSIGPLFYRAGTMILFARHFTRLIPEAKALLGVGYAFVLAWFMCLFYALPFLGKPQLNC